VVLRVPSVVVHGDYNLLLNPEHPDMVQITIGQPEPFRSTQADSLLFPFLALLAITRRAHSASAP
jgi:hypothetical protein